MVRKYEQNEFELGDEVVYNRLVKFVKGRRGKVVKKISTSSVGVDFGEGFEGHDLGGSIVTNTGWECFTNQCYNIKEGESEIIEIFLSFRKILANRLLSSYSLSLLTLAYYHRLNNNHAMFGRIMKKIIEETGINFKNKKGGKKFYGF